MRRAALVYPSNISKFSWQLERKWMRVYTASCAPSSFSSSTFETRNPGARVCRLAAIHIHVRRPSSPLSLSLSVSVSVSVSLCVPLPVPPPPVLCTSSTLSPQSSLQIHLARVASALCRRSRSPRRGSRRTCYAGATRLIGAARYVYALCPSLRLALDLLLAPGASLLPSAALLVPFRSLCPSVCRRRCRCHPFRSMRQQRPL